VTITAPDATVANPLHITFTVDASKIPAGFDLSRATVLRNGSPAGDCTGGGTATPDPCVSSRQTLAGGDFQITVLSSHASTWNIAQASAASGGGGGGGGGGGVDPAKCNAAKAAADKAEQSVKKAKKAVKKAKKKGGKKLKKAKKKLKTAKHKLKDAEQAEQEAC
jgi:hypothetical protein